MTTIAPFDLGNDEPRLVAAVEALRAHPGDIDGPTLGRILRRHARQQGVFSKSELIRGFRLLRERYGWQDEHDFVRRLRMKPVRTLSGVAPVTVLTKPYPCPGRCIFCPSDVRMPKSYLSREPGAQRAAQHAFDPYAQTLGRLLALHHTGHPVDKVEMIILGGTWSFYPETYQLWFVTRCFDAMNDFAEARSASDRGEAIGLGHGHLGYEQIDQEVEGLSSTGVDYNQVVTRFLTSRQSGALVIEAENGTWDALEAAHARNEQVVARCVGLVVETRPDHLDLAEVVRIRRLGATKVQIGYQSLDDAVLAANHRGHDVAATRRAMGLLRQAGFKIHAHWMPNLYGSDLAADRADFARLWAEADFRPDELKIYPCSLIETAELMRYHQDGRWQPYATGDLAELLADCMESVPRYCRVTRMIRDIPGDDIVTGNKVTNLRQVVDRTLDARGARSLDIRAREVRGAAIKVRDLRLEIVRYDTAIGAERFLQLVTQEDTLCGFLRLSLPKQPVNIEEIAASAMIREVHVYGRLATLDTAPEPTANPEAEARSRDRGPQRTQHRGLGRRLVEEAARLAAEAGFRDLAVIAAIGTRGYYRRLGFADGALYQHRPIGTANGALADDGSDRGIETGIGDP